MNKSYFILAVFVFLFSCSNKKTETYIFEADTTSLIRNPCMGWGVYDDANDEVQDADEYWREQDKYARKYASFFYVRWRWSDMEPQEGRYAWLYDENYKKLIQGAVDRGLKLCFRVYNHAQDNLRASTPDFVREAGAKGFLTNDGRNHWTPYIDDSVFQAKLSNFVEAFAKEYDDPGLVDFVDGVNVGYWGECHGLELQDGSEQSKEAFFDWITNLYSSNFKKVILVLPFGSNFTFEREKRIAIDGRGYAMRRDGLGSMWFQDTEREITQMMYGKTLLVGESCWWGANPDAFKNDTRYELNTWRDVYELTCDQALSYHFNTLDLRERFETRGWCEKAEDLVWEFIRRGGYRIYPSSITAPVTASVGDSIVIEHSWKNIATGYLPNNNIKWNYKYKVCFALVDESGNQLGSWIDADAEPSSWLYNTESGYSFRLKLPDDLVGVYRLMVAIVDTRTGMSPINLAVDQHCVDGWLSIGDIHIK